MRKMITAALIAGAASVAIALPANADADWCTGSHKITDPGVSTKGWGITVNGHSGIEHMSMADPGSCAFTRTTGRQPIVYTLSRKPAGAKSTPAGDTTVTADVLNVRKGPSTRTPIIRKLSKGATVDVRRVSGGWIELSGGGWVSAEFTTGFDY